jgi:hypothetical protein
MNSTLSAKRNMRKPPKPAPCPLCKSDDVGAYQIGWAVIHCRNCYLRLSRDLPLKELVEIWNKR